MYLMLIDADDTIFSKVDSSKQAKHAH